MWDLPGPGLEPVSPALAGGFLTTVPPGKPSNEEFLINTLELTHPMCCLLQSHNGGRVCINYHNTASIQKYLGNSLFAVLSCLLPSFKWITSQKEKFLERESDSSHQLTPSGLEPSMSNGMWLQNRSSQLQCFCEPMSNCVCVSSVLEKVHNSHQILKEACNPNYIDDTGSIKSSNLGQWWLYMKAILNKVFIKHRINVRDHFEK